MIGSLGRPDFSLSKIIMLLVKLKSNSLKGQTLIELVVAISVILVGVVSTLVLTIATIKGGKATKTQVIAANLAREGIEVVRMVRDSNWLKIESNAGQPSEWDANLKIGTDYISIPVFEIGRDPLWVLDFNITTMDDCITDGSDSCRIYFKDGIYAQFEVGVPHPDWIATEYYRVITTNEICEGGAIKTSGDYCNDNPKVGIQALSEVRWQERGNWRTYLLEDHIFNWR